METQTNDMKLTCIAVTFLGVGIVVVGYALYLTERAASSTFGPASAILWQTATSMYIFGVPALLFGGCLILNIFMNRRSISILRVGASRLPDSRRTVLPAVSNVGQVVCPECGFMLGPELGMKNPDGTVVCGRCNKRVIPQL